MAYSRISSMLLKFKQFPIGALLITMVHVCSTRDVTRAPFDLNDEWDDRSLVNVDTSIDMSSTILMVPFQSLSLEPRNRRQNMAPQGLSEAGGHSSPISFFLDEPSVAGQRTDSPDLTRCGACQVTNRRGSKAVFFHDMLSHVLS